jgi:hypothetical protein
MAGAEGCTVAGSTTGLAVGDPTAAGPAAAAESSAGTGGALPLAPTSMPDDPGMASSSYAISPSTGLPPSGAATAELAACCRLDVAFFFPPLPLGSSMSFPAKVKNLLPFWKVALNLLHNRPVIFSYSKTTICVLFTGSRIQRSESNQ